MTYHVIHGQTWNIHTKNGMIIDPWSVKNIPRKSPHPQYIPIWPGDFVRCKALQIRTYIYIYTYIHMRYMRLYKACIYRYMHIYMYTYIHGRYLVSGPTTSHWKSSVSLTELALCWKSPAAAEAPSIRCSSLVRCRSLCQREARWNPAWVRRNDGMMGSSGRM